MAGIFNAAIFNNAVFNVGDVAAAEEVVKTGTGGIDPRRIVKPTGILHLPKKKTRVDERVEESRAIQAEIAGRLAKEFSEETAAIPEFRPVSTMSMAEIEAEIGMLLRKQLRTDDDEVMLLMLMACVV